ncbi:MAG: hypothetical protein EOP49_02420 [Sphingobacteriales bacterium]|nr:MAG: hypothetical protein EOP49_02420 [Sphingobacteriales bacterium]
MKKVQIVMIMLLMGTLFSLSSCLKKDFDAPPDTSTIDPNLPVNMRIDSLKLRMATSGSAKRIDSNWTIYGIVTADDRSGNFYKQITIEDSTGGIAVLIDANSLYSKYPIGRKVYINLKGFYFGYYAKLPQIGGVPDNTGSMSSIPQSSVDSFIVKANFPNPLPVSRFDDLSQLKTVNNAMINRLIEVDNIQISMADTNKTYAAPPTLSSGTNINIEDCNGNKMIIRTSGYASFQAYNVPNGKGRLRAIYTVFNNTPQLVIRDTADLQFNDERCGSNAPTVSVDSIRNLYTSGSVVVGSYQIRGVVVSDRSNNNIDSKNMVFQNGASGIVLRFGAAHQFDLGDSLVINVSGGTLSEYQGTLQLANVSTSNAVALATGISVTPRVVTLSALNANFEDYESTLVKVLDVTTSASGTYGGSKTITDPTGSIVLWTFNTATTTATFASSPIFTGTKTLVGIPGQGGSSMVKQLQLRNLQDVQ